MENKAEMNCEYKNRIADYAEGLLEGAEAEEIKAHIDECGYCKAEYDACVEFCKMMESCSQPVPEELHGNIMRALNREKRRLRFMRAIKRYAAPIAAALVLAITVPAVLRANSGEVNDGISAQTELDAATDAILAPAADDGKYFAGDKSRTGETTPADARDDIEATNSECEDAVATDVAPPAETGAPESPMTEPGVVTAPPEAPESGSGENFYQYTTTFSVGGEGVAVCYMCPVFEVSEDALDRLVKKLADSIKISDEKGVLFICNDTVLEQLKLLGCDTSKAEKADYVRVNVK